MKYKVGDRVKYGSEICTVTKVLESQGKFKYRVQSDTWFDIVNEDEMFEGLVEEEVDLIPKFGEYSDNEPLDVPTMTTDFVKEHGLPCPEGYQFVDENGNIINATKIILEKKKKEYPKTYEECYQVTGLSKTSDIYGYKNGLLFEFQKLLIALNAYWKIAGEEMGLGKPWKPDWNNVSDKYCIYFVSGDAWSKECQTRQCLFAFPTPEMRDAFKENFDPDIEICKELL